MKNENPTAHELPPVVVSSGLSREHQQYLIDVIRIQDTDLFEKLYAHVMYFKSRNSIPVFKIKTQVL